MYLFILAYLCDRFGVELQKGQKGHYNFTMQLFIGYDIIWYTIMNKMYIEFVYKQKINNRW